MNLAEIQENLNAKRKQLDEKLESLPEEPSWKQKEEYDKLKRELISLEQHEQHLINSMNTTSCTLSPP